MDKNGKILKKFNIIDVFVIIAIIAVVAGIFYRFVGSSADAVRDKVTVEYVVEVEGIRQYSVDALKKMGITTDEDATVQIGEIINVEQKDVEFQSTTANGTIVQTPLPDRYTAVVTIRAECMESDNGYYTGDSEEVAVGRNVDVVTKYVSATGLVKSVTRIS